MSAMNNANDSNAIASTSTATATASRQMTRRTRGVAGMAVAGGLGVALTLGMTLGMAGSASAAVGDHHNAKPASQQASQQTDNAKAAKAAKAGKSGKSGKVKAKVRRNAKAAGGLKIRVTGAGVSEKAREGVVWEVQGQDPDTGFVVWLRAEGDRLKVRRATAAVNGSNLVDNTAACDASGDLSEPDAATILIPAGCFAGYDGALDQSWLQLGDGWLTPVPATSVTAN